MVCGDLTPGTALLKAREKAKRLVADGIGKAEEDR
jgi:hypothetical protein